MSSKTRRLDNFISTFISATEPLASPTIFRRWAGISLIAAALRQNVWVKTAHRLYPNMYVFLIAHPGVGKTRIISQARHIALKSEAVHCAPISMTFAAMVDALSEDCKVEIVRNPEGTIKYNSMYITADELGAFMAKYEPEMIDGLSHFYDPSPYQQVRRTNDVNIRIESPQINILAGSTPQNLVGFMPEKAWGQGFTSRIIMVFSDQRLIVDDFADHGPQRLDDLIHDLTHISNLWGQFTVDQKYRDAVNHWRDGGELPIPSHPRLVHYITRRRVHIYKLSMISAVNRSDHLHLTEADFFTAIEWLSQAETHMPDIFKAGATNADSQAMEDIVHWIRITNVNDLGVSEQRIISYARDKVPIHSILRIIDILESSGQIKEIRRDRRTGSRHFIAVDEPKLD